MTSNGVDQSKVHGRHRGTGIRVALVLFVTLAMVLQNLMCGSITRSFASEAGDSSGMQESGDAQQTDASAQTTDAADGQNGLDAQADDDAQGEDTQGDGQETPQEGEGQEGQEDQAGDDQQTPTEDEGQADDQEPTATTGEDDGTVPDTEADGNGLKVHKVVTGDEYTGDEEFSFTLAAVDEAPMPESDTSVKVKAGETGSFGDIAYAEAGSYYYTITEAEPETKTNGMTYNTEAVWARVDVADDLSTATVYGTEEEVHEDNAFEAEGAQTENATIENQYAKPTSATVALKVTKQIVGSKYEGAEAFKFELKAVDEAPMPESGATTQAKAGETAAFGEITYTAAGTYYYNITEVTPEEKTLGMTYNKDTVWARVDVAENFSSTVHYGTEGEVKESISTQTESAVVENQYVDTGTIEVSKVVKSSREDDKTRDYAFKIVLYEADGNTVKQSVDGEYGDVKFEKGVATFTLHDGETKAARGLPLGAEKEPFTIEETNAFGLQPSWEKNNPEDGITWKYVCTNTYVAPNPGTKSPTKTTSAPAKTTTSTRAATPKTADPTSGVALVSAIASGLAAMGLGLGSRRRQK